jgi:hypothetical protein
MLVKEEKDEKEEKKPPTISKEDSSGIVGSSRESSPVNEQTNSGNCFGSEIKQEINIEDEDTIEGPSVFMTVPKDEVKQMYNSTNMTEESSVSGPGVRTPIPGSVHNKWMISFTSGIQNETEEQYEVPSETSESQMIEASVDGKSSLHALEVMEPLEQSSSDTSVVTRVDKVKRVEGVPYNLAKIMKTHGCSAYVHHQNTNLASKQIKPPRELPANLENNVCRNIDSDMRRHSSSPECPSGKSPDNSPKNEKKSSRPTDSLLPKIEEVSCACSTCAETEKFVHLNHFDCNQNSEERSRSLQKEECCKSKTAKKTFFRNLESRPPAMSIKVTSQEDVTAEERLSKSSANTSNSKSHKEPINDGEVKENENYVNDPDKERSICRIVDQADWKHAVCTHVESESAAEDVNEVGESRELSSGTRCASPSKIAKKRRKARFLSTDKLQHGSNKETSCNNSKTRKKPRGPRKPRYSRKSFRHDSIQTFKVSTVFPPHNTPVPWRYKCKNPELVDPLNTDSVNLPSPILSPIVTESRVVDGCVTNIEIQDDIPSPASLTIDLGEQNTNASETSNLEGGERSRRKSNNDANGVERDSVSCISPTRRMSCEAGLSSINDKPSLAASPENQCGGMDSESSDEGQSKKRRKRVKKKKSGMIFQVLLFLLLLLLLLLIII